MDNWNSWTKQMISSLLAIATLTTSLSADNKNETTHYGFIRLSEKDAKHLDEEMQKVVEVKPNQIGAKRVRKHLKKKGEQPIDLPVVSSGAEEWTTLKISLAQAAQMMDSTIPLPAAVDNSKLPSFPPIGNQQRLGSCVAWGSTYYHATHELGLANGTNNKAGFQTVLSPKWTYNLINHGSDTGSSPIDAYQLLSTHGAPSLANFPYDQSYTAWNLNLQDWIAALSNRLGQAVAIPGLGGSSPQNLTAIKSVLNNGHIVTFATFIDSWIFTQIKQDPENPNSPHVGEWAASWMNGMNGGHFMTIVGYDDNLWIDINNNGVVDPGERGAFLVANSWGPDWGNHGFIWISYDAFRQTSSVPNGPQLGRVPAGYALNSCVISVLPKAPHYTPKLIAEFSLTQSFRDEIKIQTGISNTNKTKPKVSVTIPAFNNQGGDYEFSGQKTAKPTTATFAIDLTDLLPTQEMAQRYYLVVGDTMLQHPTVLNSFSLVDLVHQTQVNSTNVPQTYDFSQGINFIDYLFPLRN